MSSCSLQESSSSPRAPPFPEAGEKAASKSCRSRPSCRSMVMRFTHTPDARQLIFVMVGLPARGKSFIALQLKRFMSWRGIETKVFNVGNFRRATETGVQDASYFDAQNEKFKNRREELAMLVLDDLLEWLGTEEEAGVAGVGDVRGEEAGVTGVGAMASDVFSRTTTHHHQDFGGGAIGRCAIFDATNTTRSRRNRVATEIYNRLGRHEVGVVFIESICSDPDVIEANLRVKFERSPDYAGKEATQARTDLERRINHYERVYEPLTEKAFEILVSSKGGHVMSSQISDSSAAQESADAEKAFISISYIKLFDLSSHVTAHNIFGMASVTLLPYLMALHVGTRPVFLCNVDAVDNAQGGLSCEQIAQFLLSSEHCRAGSEQAAVGQAAVLDDLDDLIVFSCTTDSARQFVQKLDGASSSEMIAPSTTGDSSTTNPTTSRAQRNQTIRIASTRFRGALNRPSDSCSAWVERAQLLTSVLIEVTQTCRPVLVLAPRSILEVLYTYFSGCDPPSGSTMGSSLIEFLPRGACFAERKGSGMS
ncbi:unnamed protein product [Amoebophrya sp. A25]|nr:unnamed protein product [Amoebophrya sp. A25]|eukprot:GSA25T00001551001.1